MIYKPQKNNRAKWLSPLFILGGIALMAASNLVNDRRLMFQLLSAMVIVIGIQILVRYVMSEYRYVIEDADNGTSDFLVIKTQGKKEIKVCHISVNHIESVTAYDKKQKKADLLYNYVQNPGAEAYSVIFRDGEHRTAVIIECDGAFADELKKRMISDGDGGTVFAM